MVSEIKVIVIDDSKNICEILCSVLTKNGHETYSAESGKTGIELIKKHKPDLVIVDMYIPDLDGIYICKYLRSNPEVCRQPIIIGISGMTEDEKINEAYEIGMNDFMEKPIKIKELVLKINSYSHIMTEKKQGMASAERKELEYSNIRIDLMSERVMLKDDELALTRIEYELLTYMIKQRGLMLTREKIMDEVWKTKYIDSSDRTVDTTICRLKSKIPDLDGKIKTMRGKGYRLEK